MSYEQTNFIRTDKKKIRLLNRYKFAMLVSSPVYKAGGEPQC